MIQHRIERAGRARCRQRVHQRFHRLARNRAVRAHLGDHLAHLHKGRILAPAIIIGHHADQRIRQLRLPRELGLRHRGHADHVRAPLPVEVAFRAGGKLRAFHRQIGAALGHRAARFGHRFRGEGAHPLAHRLGHRDMGHHAAAEEAARTALGAIDELIDHHEMAGRQLLAQAADRADRQDIGATAALQRIHIGAGIEVRRGDPVPPAMARQKPQLHIADAPEQDLVGRRTPGRFDRAPLLILQSVDGI